MKHIVLIMIVNDPDTLRTEAKQYEFKTRDINAVGTDEELKNAVIKIKKEYNRENKK